VKLEKQDPEAILQKVRSICLSLPESGERTSWGHPTFTVHDRPFAVFEEFKKEWCLCFRVELRHQSLFLKDARFFSTPYIGKQGWVSLRVHAAPLRWTEVRHLLAESHHLVRSLPKAKSKRAKTSP
jgi:predicted DNA-binding protein (MmcQ/YjbR family)